MRIIVNFVCRFYKNIIPYGSPLKPYCSNVNYEDGVGACGSGCIILGLLPQNKISVCHNGFVELLEDYKKQKLEENENGR